MTRTVMKVSLLNYIEQQKAVLSPGKVLDYIELVLIPDKSSGLKLMMAENCMITPTMD